MQVGETGNQHATYLFLTPTNFVGRIRPHAPEVIPQFRPEVQVTKPKKRRLGRGLQSKAGGGSCTFWAGLRDEETRGRLFTCRRAKRKFLKIPLTSHERCTFALHCTVCTCMPFVCGLHAYLYTLVLLGKVKHCQLRGHQTGGFLRARNDGGNGLTTKKMRCLFSFAGIRRVRQTPGFPRTSIGRTKSLAAEGGAPSRAGGWKGAVELHPIFRLRWAFRRLPANLQDMVSKASLVGRFPVARGRQAPAPGHLIKLVVHAWLGFWRSRLTRLPHNRGGSFICGGYHSGVTSHTSSHTSPAIHHQLPIAVDIIVSLSASTFGLDCLGMFSFHLLKIVRFSHAIYLFIYYPSIYFPMLVKKRSLSLLAFLFLFFSLVRGSTKMEGLRPAHPKEGQPAGAAFGTGGTGDRQACIRLGRISAASFGVASSTGNRVACPCGDARKSYLGVHLNLVVRYGLQGFCISCVASNPSELHG